MSAYRSHMGRDALENGPHEPRLVPCRYCRGAGWHTWPNVNKSVCCPVCDGTGEIEADEDGDDL